MATWQMAVAVQAKGVAYAGGSRSTPGRSTWQQQGAAGKPERAHALRGSQPGTTGTRMTRLSSLKRGR
jgi:hypothetical protein